MTNQPRGKQRYRAIRQEDEDALTQAIIQLASQYGRYGYRRIMTLLKQADSRVGKDRGERIWRRKVHRSRSRAAGYGSTMAHVCAQTDTSQPRVELRLRQRADV